MKPKETARTGRAIYAKKLQSKLEPEHIGQYIAIELDSEAYFIADSPDEAITYAQKACPTGTFHLIRIGFPGAYHLSAVISDSDNWEF